MKLNQQQYATGWVLCQVQFTFEVKSNPKEHFK
jgi:hypothetical protein